MTKRVVDTAETKCSFGSKKSEFRMPENTHSRRIENKNAANIGDHISQKNIKPFGLCKSPSNPAVAAALNNPQPCVPVTPLKWQLGNKHIHLDGEFVLHDGCTCSCMWHGIIEITDAGQNSHYIGSKEPKPATDEEKQQTSQKMEEFKQTEEGKKIIQKAEEDATVEIINQRKKIAYNFYKRNGFKRKDINNAIKDIDLEKSVSLEKVSAGQEFDQWQIPTAGQGNYYAEVGEQPTNVGINPKGEDWNTKQIMDRVVNRYKTIRGVQTLKSTAKPGFIDNFSIESQPYTTQGGAQQYFTSEKDAFEKIN